MLTSLLRWWKQGRPLPIPVSRSTTQVHNDTQCGNNDKNPDRCCLVFLSTVLVSLMGDPVVMLSLYPDFPQAVLSSFASCGEFVFLLDCSGSMSSPLNRSKKNETRIASARVLIIYCLAHIYQAECGLDVLFCLKDTLRLLLKSLPMGCYFNIYTFGSSFEHIFP